MTGTEFLPDQAPSLLFWSAALESQRNGENWSAAIQQVASTKEFRDLILDAACRQTIRANGDKVRGNGALYLVRSPGFPLFLGDCPAEGASDRELAATIMKLTDAFRGPVSTRSTAPEIKDVVGKATNNQVELTIRGTGFADPSVVKLGQQSLTPTLASKDELKVLIPTDVIASGPVTVAVVAAGVSSEDYEFTLPDSLFQLVQAVAVPTITKLDRASAIVGAPAFTLDVYGTGFSQNSEVRVDGTRRQTQFLNAQRLAASMLDNDMAAVRTLGVTVVTPGQRTSNKIQFPVKEPAKK
jgi:hypothetical protein